MKNLAIAILTVLCVVLSWKYRAHNIEIRHQQDTITRLTMNESSLNEWNAELTQDRTKLVASTLLNLAALRLAEYRIRTGHVPTFAFFSRFIDQLRLDNPGFDINGSLGTSGEQMTLWINDDQHQQLAKVECNLRDGSLITPHLEFER